jgi:hypothetical protein
LVYYDPTGNTYVPLEVPTQYVNKHYDSVKAYDLAWRKQTDKDFAKRVELGEIIDRKMRSDKSAENIVLGSSQLEHEAMLFLQDQIYVHGQQALEVTVEQLLESKRLYLKTGDKIYLTLFKNAYVDYVASKNTYSELGFEIKNGFVKDENYYETLYNIYYREDNFKEWLLLERNLQTLFAEAQAHINAGIQLGSMGVLQNMASSYTNVNNNLNSLDIKNSRLDKMEYNAYTGNVNEPTNSVPQTSFKYKLNKDFRVIFKLKETGNNAGVGNKGTSSLVNGEAHNAANFAKLKQQLAREELAASDSAKWWGKLDDGTNQGVKHFYDYWEKYPERIPSLAERLGVDASDFANTPKGFENFTNKALDVATNPSAQVRQIGDKTIYYMDGVANAKKGIVVITKDGGIQSMMPSDPKSFLKLK